MTEQKSYSFIAQFYDAIMGDLDYEYWADYIDGIIQEHHINTKDILELAAGTGSLALSLNELGCYNILATDLSAEMIKVAKTKEAEFPEHISFDVADFTNLTYQDKFDLSLCIFDSFNYMTEEKQIEAFFEGNARALRNGGYLIFDFVTHKHCLESVEEFKYEECFKDGFHYIRSAEYEAKERIHTTHFKILANEASNHQEVNESHLQKAYTLDYLEDIAKKNHFVLEAAYADFTDEAPTSTSKRITVVLQCQKQ